MAKTTAKLLGLALLGAGAYGLWTMGQGLVGDDSAADTRNVVNQVWIERAPEGPRDMIAHLVLLDLPEGRFGGAGKSSQWRHLLEVFQWGLEGSRLSVFFPQDRVKAQLRVRSWECEGEAPAPFELCLEISNGRRKAVFYSMEEWHIDPERAGESLAVLQGAHPELAGLRRDVVVPVEIEQVELDDYAQVDAMLLGEQ
ncbi:hypothetical protein [Paraliomyxa miuraensis]|uniref:hypothetical protein n=1 Tax=Paraliomyxa miuraensis TaxID=376150 RepID=UPI002253E47A|nr:hypothetical protein [Paraliomyxa miuraensis]MCX4243780.1 hypothetical protein [Paraliomyxa miuraensis]